MSEVIEKVRPKYIVEPLPLTIELDEQAIQRAGNVVLELGNSAMRFAQIERVPRYHETRRENDAEHSFMLALVAPELAEQFFTDLDAGLVSRFSTLHDLVELETKDVPTFIMTPEALAAKAANEAAALERLCTQLPAKTAELLRRYEHQLEPEARFVRFVDKLLPLVVDIYGPGHLVMREDYGVDSLARLHEAEVDLKARFEAMFPEPEFDLLHRLHGDLCEQFAAYFARHLSA